jgi:uncharacterized membrane protein
MLRLDLSELQNELLRSGVAPRVVRRTVGELSDHYEDLVDCALADGVESDAAEQRALAELGDWHDLAAAVRSRPELRSWAHRFPYLALIVYPLTCLAVLPAMPVMVGVANAAHLVRWAACIVLSAVVTSAIFLFMQLTIALT